MWEQIRANKRKAFWLICLMALILVAMGWTVAEAFQPGSGAFGVLIALGILVTQLSVYALAGESVLMAGLGARPMPQEESPRLYNLVEEMQLASGLGYMPRIYIIDTDAPNAFAVGRKPETSIVAVTRGLVYRLNRDELQGVIAHEIAHLKNLDTRFMTLAGVMMGSIIIMSDLALRMFFYGGRGNSRAKSRGDNGGGGGQAQAIIFIIALVLIILGPILARVLYFALSRAREYLADASAAVYTRYPEGLASALMKIAGTANRPGASIGEVNRAVAPMFIVNPLKGNALTASDSVFSTHPPVVDRIRVLRSMGGASFADYDHAFQQIKNGKHIIGQQTLSASAAVAKRPPSLETALGNEPIQTRDETKAIVHAMYGYADVLCQCGATLRVPSSYNESTLRCIRCGAVNATPAFPPPEVKLSHAERRRQAEMQQRQTQGPLEYTRKSPGVWEGFPCVCGTSIQLSPIFSGSSIECRKCGQIYRIHQPAAGKV